MTDRYETWAGPYVLGALAPAERDEFVAHLGECARCRGDVEDLAALPGLLSRVRPDAVAALAEDAGPPPAPALPDTLLPSLLRAARRRRRQVLAVAVGAAAAAVAAVVLAVTVPGSSPAPPSQAVATTRPAVPMRPLVDAPVTASVSLTPAAWGTRLDLTCRYEGYARGDVPYVLVVLGRDGHTEQVGSWTAHPGTAARMSGATSLTGAQIADVQIRTQSGRALLGLTATPG